MLCFSRETLAIVQNLYLTNMQLKNMQTFIETSFPSTSACTIIRVSECSMMSVSSTVSTISPFTILKWGTLQSKFANSVHCVVQLQQDHTIWQHSRITTTFCTVTPNPHIHSPMSIFPPVVVRVVGLNGVIVHPPPVDTSSTEWRKMHD